VTVVESLQQLRGLLRLAERTYADADSPDGWIRVNRSEAIGIMHGLGDIVATIEHLARGATEADQAPPTRH
jgi:hypothetical protein